LKDSIYESGEYVDKNPSYHTEDSPWKARQILRMLERQSLPIRSVCEVGCGAGEILRQLQLQMPQETRFYGYEISPQAYGLCKERENERLTCRCEDLLSVETEPFDLLLCIDVFEHVEDYLGFLKRLKGKARYKMFHIPLDLSAQSVMRSRPLMVTRAGVGHLHYFTKDTALATLRDAGYEVIDHFYTAGGNEIGKTMKSKLARLPRSLFYALQPDLAVRTLGGYSLLALAQ